MHVDELDGNIYQIQLKWAIHFVLKEVAYVGAN